MCFSWTSGDARGLGLLFMVCACAGGLRGNRLTWMRGTWGVIWRSAHGPMIPVTRLRRAKAWGRTAHASHHHATRGLPINVYVLYPMLAICALSGRERSREFFDNVSMLMSHVTTFSLSDWLRAKFAALWLVTTWSSPVYYSYTETTFFIDEDKY